MGTSSRTKLRHNSRRNHEHGIVIILVAVVMLFIVGAMAALSIDVVTLYTARSEAQLAADGAALAGARVLANSGMTSRPADTTLSSNAKALASAVATQVAQANEVGGRNPVAIGEVTVSFPNETAANFGVNPHVTVQVQRTDLPTFFARIWGSKQITVTARATAEAYNPSGASASVLGGKPPVEPVCVKPWLLPNIDPSSPTNPIFVTTTGALASTTTSLLGWTSTNAATRLQPACIDCSTLPAPTTFQYYPGGTATTSTFPPPTQALPTCNPALTTAYEISIAGCVQTPIKCNGTAIIDTSPYVNRETETAHAVNCLTHATAGEADQVDLTAAAAPSPPFQFLVGADNPVAVVNASLVGKDAMVSDSLVTVPVFDSGDNTLPPPNPVQIVGFVQLFLNPDGDATPTTGPNLGHMKATVINMVGCGSAASGTPILGNGASPVAVRLISP